MSEEGATPAGLRLAFAGGGTGGHVIPGLHLAAWAAERGVALDLLWFGAGRAVEERVFRGAASGGEPNRLERITLPLEPPGGGAPSRARLLLHLLPATLSARRALKRARTRVCLGLGGYTVVPVVLAARSLGIPVLLLEVNAHPGLATRWLSRLAQRVVHAWPGSVPPGADERHVVFGPPLGPAFLTDEPDEAARCAARAELGFDPERPLLLVLGGSQGAQGLNRFCVEHAAALVASGLQVLHQVGPGRLDEAAAGEPGYRAVEYVDDVRAALDASVLVLCRGGASTLAEIAARGTPALVVPYPHHADRHQEKNAHNLGDGVTVVHEEDLGPATCAELLALSGEEGRAERERRRAALRAALPRDGAARLLELLRRTD